MNFLISQAMKFYAAHEVFHTGNLVPPIGGHDPVGTGNFLDSGIMTKVDNKSSGFNTFYIPTLPTASRACKEQLLVRIALRPGLERGVGSSDRIINERKGDER